MPALRLSKQTLPSLRPPPLERVDPVLRLSTSPGSNPILLAPRALLSSLFSFEALLLLYMFAGFYKGDPRFAWIPVDATALFFALSVVVGSFIIVVNPIYKKGLPVVFAMICLVVWFLVTLTWSPSRIYGPDKVFFMATLELWAVIAGALIIAPDPARIRRLLSLTLLLSLWVGLEALMVYVETGHTQISVGSANYLMLGRICGFGLVVALAGWLYGRGRATRALCLGMVFGLGAVLMVSGARGPLLATALALLLPLAIGVRLTTRSIRYSRTMVSVIMLLLAVAGSVILYTAITERMPGTFQRFERLVAGAGGELRGSEAVRIEHYKTAFDLWSQAPLLGHGVGSWPLLTGRPDDRYFPHNMFLEVLVEAGLVGLVFLGALFATAFRAFSLERLRRDPQALCATMLFASALLNAMLSGDIADNRVVFMWMGLLALFALARPVAAAPTSSPSLSPSDLSMARRSGLSRERHADFQPAKAVPAQQGSKMSS